MTTPDFSSPSNSSDSSVETTGELKLFSEESNPWPHTDGPLEPSLLNQASLEASFTGPLSLADDTLWRAIETQLNLDAEQATLIAESGILADSLLPEALPETISAYIDAELPLHEQQGLEQHLTTSPQVAAQVGNWQALKTLLARFNQRLEERVPPLSPQVMAEMLDTLPEPTSAESTLPGTSLKPPVPFAHKKRTLTLRWWQQTTAAVVLAVVCSVGTTAWLLPKLSPAPKALQPSLSTEGAPALQVEPVLSSGPLTANGLSNPSLAPQLNAEPPIYTPYAARFDHTPSAEEYLLGLHQAEPLKASDELSIIMEL